MSPLNLDYVEDAQGLSTGGADFMAVGSLVHIGVMSEANLLTIR